MPTPKFNFRDVVRDVVTKCEGVITARTEWDSGCVRFAVQPTKLKDGAPVEAIWFDEQRLVLVKAAPGSTRPARGGPQRDPRQPVGA